MESIIFLRQIDIIFNITIIVAQASLIDGHTQQGFGFIDVDAATAGFKRQRCRQEYFRCQMKQKRFFDAVCGGYRAASSTVCEFPSELDRQAPSSLAISLAFDAISASIN